MLTFGGKVVGKDKTFSNKVYKTNPKSGASCLHSELPIDGAKEIHVFEFQDTLLACSSFIWDGGKIMRNHLKCWKWSGEAWQTFEVNPEKNGVQNWISALKASDKGKCNKINFLNALYCIIYLFL